MRARYESMTKRHVFQSKNGLQRFIVLPPAIQIIIIINRAVKQ
jgi:hypothetical protein